MYDDISSISDTDDIDEADGLDGLDLELDDLEIPDLWVAHDRPEQPLAHGAWLCDCDKCRMVLRATVAKAQCRWWSLTLAEDQTVGPEADNPMLPRTRVVG